MNSLFRIFESIPNPTETFLKVHFDREKKTYKAAIYAVILIPIYLFTVY